MRTMILALATSALALASPATAQQAVTTLESGAVPSTNDGKTFTSNPADNRLNADATMSSATISPTSPISTNGSIDIEGRRSRVYNNMSGLNIASDTLVSLAGDYQVNNGSTDGIQSPAFRVYVNGSNTVDGYSGVSELIWEAANNGGYTLGSPDALSANDLFWRQIVGVGFDGTGGIATGGYVLHTVADWGDLLGGTVLGIGVGNGGCPSECSHFSAYADNLVLNTDSTSYAYDFQAPQTAAAVPEPATWALMLMGFGGVGFQLRRSKRSRTLMQVA